MVRIETDFTSFKIGLIEATFKTEVASVEGMKEAVLAFMDDSLHEPPACPRKSGSLAGSHSAFVNGQLIATSESEYIEGGEGPTPLMSLTKVSRGIEGALIAHKSYAAAQHEGISRGGGVHAYSTSGTGRKWIESKLLRHGEKYLEMIAGRIRRAK